MWKIIHTKEDEHDVVCSECGAYLITLSNHNYTLEQATYALRSTLKKNKYCFNCGAKMESNEDENSD